MTKFDDALVPPKPRSRIDAALAELLERDDFLAEWASADVALRNPAISAYRVAAGFAALDILVSREAVSGWRKLNGIK